MAPSNGETVWYRKIKLDQEQRNAVFDLGEHGSCSSNTRQSLYSYDLQRTEQSVIQSGNCESSSRQQNALKALVSEADHWERTQEGPKLAAKEDLALTAEWNAEVEMKIIEADHKVSRLKAWLEEAKREDSQKVREDELKFKHKLFKATPLPN